MNHDGAIPRPQIIRFGPFELHVREAELRKHGVKVRLHEQPFRILLLLLDHPGEVVLREEIRKALWPNDTIVEFDSGINAAIQRLRNSLGDSADKPRYVETVARRGYRFVGTLEPAEAVATEAAPPDAELARGGDPGDRVGATFSHFRLIGKLGSGGMGVVYRAEDLKLRRQVAVKFLPVSAEEATPQVLHRFQREARAASALNHPHICTIHSVEEIDGQPAIVMELVEGETLAARIARGALALQETLPVAIQLAQALEAAHARGIVHRDLKPANIMLAKSGVKVLDFGLAKMQPAPGSGAEAPTRTAAEETGPGIVMGTLPYMSPEQLRGLSLTDRTDLFSLGVLLYEMLTGQRPFQGDSAMAVCDAILHDPPRDFGDVPAPHRLQSFIRQLLEKDPAKRLDSQAALRELRSLASALSPAVRTSRRGWWLAGAAALAACLIATWFWRQSARERWVRETRMPEIERLVDAGEYVQAAALADQARSILPKDPALEKLYLRATGEISMSSVPPDADVSIRLYKSDPNAWQTVGKTPLSKIRVPRAAYVWRVTKPGFATAYIIAQPPGEALFGYGSTLDVKWNLRPEKSVPAEMVVVAGGRVGLTFPFNQAPYVAVADFLIDRTEVTNEEYKRFLDAGGYRNPSYWKEPFVKDGRSLSFEQAMKFFEDATGRPGPATWEIGDYPKGHEKYPVAGVSWYEAAAYARFAGKSLPTAYHWMIASQASQDRLPSGLLVPSTGFPTLITEGSNFHGEGPRPVGSPGALSGFGTNDMAGNVKEWCSNEAPPGRRFILGGSFGSPEYEFNHTDAQPAWDRRPNFGFRCVRFDGPVSAAAAPITITTRDYSRERPVTNEVFKALTATYDYDKAALDARLEETVASQGWTRDKVTFSAAYSPARVTGYLYVPRNAPLPLQTIVFFPGAGAFLSDQIDLPQIEGQFDFLIKSGRGLFVPIYKGSYERRDDYQSGGQPPTMYRDHVIAWSKDLRRSIDYLETRKEIDATRIGYFGASLGGTEAAIMAAMEKRLKVLVLSSGGLYLRRDLPEADPFNFAPRVTVPVLMINGRYDATYPVESSQRPLFSGFGAPETDKKYVIYDGGHGVFPRPEAVRETLQWLDQHLGPVRR